MNEELRLRHLGEGAQGYHSPMNKVSGALGQKSLAIVEPRGSYQRQDLVILAD